MYRAGEVSRYLQYVGSARAYPSRRRQKKRRKLKENPFRGLVRWGFTTKQGGRTSDPRRVKPHGNPTLLEGYDEAGRQGGLCEFHCEARGIKHEGNLSHPKSQPRSACREFRELVCHAMHQQCLNQNALRTFKCSSCTIHNQGKFNAGTAQLRAPASCRLNEYDTMCMESVQVPRPLTQDWLSSVTPKLPRLRCRKASLIVKILRFTDCTVPFMYRTCSSDRRICIICIA